MVKLNQIAKWLKYEVWRRKTKLNHNLCRAIKMKIQNKLKIKKMYFTIHFTVMKHEYRYSIKDILGEIYSL